MGEQTQTLYTLLLKVGAAAAVASILVRFHAFQRMMLREDRTLHERWNFALVFGGVFGAGVVARVATGTYLAADLSVAGSLLAGVLGGYFAGLISGILIGLPAFALNQEYLALPLCAGIGVMGGLVRDVAPDTEEIWRFSPFFDLIGLYRFWRKGTDRRRMAFQMLFLLAILVAESLRMILSYVFLPANVLFTPFPDELRGHWSLLAGSFTSTVFCAAVPIKIWNNLRTEKKLEAQQRLATEARLQALTYQINPHFLFNTLNSVSSLIRLNPEEARTVVYKLSSILRKLLRKTEHLTTLGEELSFIDDYLSIEKVRFRDKLRIEIDVEPGARECLVPSMFLQPLVENSIKHGISPKLDGGTIRIRARHGSGRLQLVIEDDGVGIAEERLGDVFQQGIGVSNINERLKVLYGEQYRMDVDSKPGAGTRFEIEMPAAELVRA